MTRGRGLLVVLFLLCLPAPQPQAVPLAVSAHIFILPQGHQLRISEYFEVQNVGAETYQGRWDPDFGARVTLTFTPPSGTEQLHFDGPGLGERFVGDASRFADTLALSPGQTTRIGYSYVLPDAEGLRITRTFDFPVASLALFLGDEAFALDGAGLRGGAVSAVGARRGRLYAARPLDAGAPLILDILPAGTRPARRFSPVELGVGLMALGAALAALAWMGRAAALPQQPPERLRPLVRAAAELDLAFAAGALPEPAYRERRAALKARLLADIAEPHPYAPGD